MSRKHPAVKSVSNGQTRASQVAMHETAIREKHLLWAEMVKRKEESKKAEEKPKTGRPKLKTGLLDKYFIGSSHSRAKGLSAYIVSYKHRNSTISVFDLANRYDMSETTLHNYFRAHTGGLKLPKYILKMKKKLDEDISQSSTSISEMKRLRGLANRHLGASPHVEQNEETIEEYDHMLNTEQKGQLLDIANIELSEPKSLTKSDVVTGVIVGAIVGAALTAYIFLTNGAI